MYYNNKKLIASIFWLVLGVALMALSIAGVLDSSMYSGMGGALAAVGFLQIIRNLKYRSDSGYREKIDTEAGDERNRFLRMKSWAWAGYIVIFAEGIGVIAAMIAGQHTIQLVLSCSVCLILIVYWCSYLVLKRKY